jgi:hypothetical protein
MNHKFLAIKTYTLIVIHAISFLGHVTSEPSVSVHNTTVDTNVLVESSSEQSPPCSDETRFQFFVDHGVKKRCAWLQKISVKKEEKMAKYCENEQVAMNCRLSCGTCTIDAINYTITGGNGNTTWEPWSFVVFADIHGLTPFSFDPFDESIPAWRNSLKTLTHIKEKYGAGDIVLLPGDMLSFGGLSNEVIATLLRQNLSIPESIYTASKNCYRTTKELFQRAGYGTVLAAVGDHELGGNNGFRVNKKLSTIPSYRQGFVSGWNRNQTTGEPIFHDLIMDTPSRPLGTPYEGSSYAYQYKNALFISVDAFRQVGDGHENYFDREHGFGGEGAITCDVSGDHLAWFEAVLKAARSDESIKHIFVQAHLPIIQPVRKVRCSVSTMSKHIFTEL